MTLKIAGLAIIYTVTYRLYRRRLPRIRRRLGIALGKLNETTITLGLGRLSQVAVFAVTSFLTYFIAKHQQWAPWRSIFKGYSSPSAILSDNAPALLAILVFITSSAANAVRDRKQGGTYFGEFLSSYLIYRSITSDIIWTPLFNALTFVVLVFPLFINLLNTGESSFFYWGTMNPYTTALSIWTSALIVVAIVLLFNFLSLLNQAMTQLFHPDAIKTHIRNDVKARVYSNIKTIFKLKDGDKRGLTNASITNYIEIMDSFPEEEQVKYFQVTVGSAAWSPISSLTYKSSGQRSTQNIRGWKCRRLQHPIVSLSFLRHTIQLERLHSLEQVMRGRHDAIIAALNSQTSVSKSLHNQLLTQVTYDAALMDKLVYRARFPDWGNEDFKETGIVSEVNRLPETHSLSVISRNIMPRFPYDQLQDVPWVISLTSITYRELARTIHNSFPPTTPLSDRHSIISLDMILSSANAIIHEPTRRYVLHTLIEALISSLIINRHPDEKLSADVLEILIPTLRLQIRSPQRLELPPSSSELRIAMDELLVNCIKTHLRPLTPLSPESYSEMLKYVSEEERVAAFLYMLIYNNVRGYEVSATVLASFVEALRHHRRILGDSIKELYKTTPTFFDGSSFFSHVPSRSGLKWLLEILEAPITVSVYLDLIEREKCGDIKLDFTSLLLWRTLVGRRLYYGEHFIENGTDSLTEWDIEKARRGAINAADILERAGMEDEARILRSIFPPQESPEDLAEQKPQKTVSARPLTHLHRKPTPGADRRLSNRQMHRRQH
ncbi:hypothetical protein RMW62_06470 [Actinomyces oris]|jgi:membrane protein|uniref:Uncharacterized protein n=1 Tax=Actinomyces oris TaxID=544580 RepID=A0AAE4G2M7_9ACTO|nr:hypothetical protein [Actinomyces oris]MDT0248726.1 hypothetical protein [Actinomyces oris]